MKGVKITKTLSLASKLAPKITFRMWITETKAWTNIRDLNSHLNPKQEPLSLLLQLQSKLKVYSNVWFYLFVLSMNNSWAHKTTQRSRTVSICKTIVTCDNADIPGPFRDQKHTLSLMSCKFCLPEVCTHLAHTSHTPPKKTRDERRKCLYVEENKMKTDEKRKTEKILNKLGLYQPHPDTEDGSVCNPRTTSSMFPPPVCVSESNTCCKLWKWTQEYPDGHQKWNQRSKWSLVEQERRMQVGRKVELQYPEVDD